MVAFAFFCWHIPGVGPPAERNRDRDGEPTINFYDWYVSVRGNRVEQVWPITARGAVY